MPTSVKLLLPRLGIWLALVVSVGVLGAYQLSQGMTFRADMLTLLPEVQQQPRVAQAIDQVTGQFEQQFQLALVSDGSSQLSLAELQSWATYLQTQLDATQLFEAQTVALQMGPGAWFDGRYGLVSEQTADLIRDDPEALLDATTLVLYGLAGSALAVDLAQDPLQLGSQYAANFMPESVEPVTNNLFLVGTGDNAFLFGSMRVINSGFDASTAQRLVDMVSALRIWAHTQGATLRSSGLPIFAAHGTVQARYEISVFGSLSLLGVLLLLVTTFADVRPLLGTLTCIATGIASALVMTHFVFGEIHLITLVFGASLIGISVDYALHFFCDGFSSPNWTPEQGLRSVGSGVSLAAASSVVAFLSFLVTPFPGLQQIAVFSATGLVASWVYGNDLAANN